MTNRFPCLLVLAILTVPLAIANGQGLPGHIDHIFPAGGQRGTTVEVNVVGNNLDLASDVRVAGDGVTGTISKVDKGKSVGISVTLADDAEPGTRDLRLITPAGATNRFRFVVSAIPEVIETEPNSEVPDAQVLPPLPVVVNGQAHGADKDTFRFSAKAGQTVVCQVEARTLVPFLADAVPGWFQAVLTLRDAQGKRLAYVDDFRFHPDPVLIHQVEKDGDYMVEIRDSIYRGRGDFVYRISLGEMPYMTDIYPLGAPRDSTCKVTLRGVNLPKKSLDLTLKADDPPVRLVELDGSAGLRSNPLPFAVGNTPETQEVEPNNTPEKAIRVKTPITINGRIAQPGDIDCFTFSAEAGDRLIMEVHARRLESPLDSRLVVLDAKGVKLADDDDTEDIVQTLMTHHADARVPYAFKTAGDYTLKLCDIQGKGGEEYAYRLTLAPPRPDFQLRVTPDNPRVGQGDTTVLTVTALRHDGFKGAIALSVEDLPEGFTTSGTGISAEENTTLLALTAPADTPLGLESPTIVGTATLGGKTVTRRALPAEDDMQAFIYHHLVPTQEFLLTVSKPPPFKLIPQLPESGYLRLGAGRTAFLTVKVERTAAARGPVRLTLTDPPKGTRMRTVSILPGQDEAKCTFTVSNQTPKGFKQNLIILGTMKVGSENLTSITPVIPLLGPSAKKP